MKISELLPEKKRIYDVRNIFLDSDKNDKNHINNMFNQALDDCTASLTEAVKRGDICVDVPSEEFIEERFWIRALHITAKDRYEVANCDRWIITKQDFNEYVKEIIERLRRGV